MAEQKHEDETKRGHSPAATGGSKDPNARDGKDKSKKYISKQYRRFWLFMSRPRTTNVIQGFSTALIAVFTILLFYVSKEQINVTVSTQRAYMVVLPAMVKNSFTVGSYPEISGQIKNNGLTPARLKIWTMIDRRPTPFPRGSELPTAQFGPEISIPAEAQYGIPIKLTHRLPLTSRDIEDLKGGFNQRIYYWGRIEYVDAFSNSRWKDFCYFTIDTDAMTPCDERNDGN